MKNNQGVTIITLVITIIVMVLIASITIYTGMNTVESARKKAVTDVTNAVYLALIANDKEFTTSNEVGLTNEDFEKLNLDYSTDDYKITYTREDDIANNLIKYKVKSVDKYDHVYEEEYSYYKEFSKTTTKAEFDEFKRVNRPVLDSDEMKAKSYSGEDINNVYSENWYNYTKGSSKLAIMEYESKLYAWIPRFAYKIQNFYVGKSYDIVPSTAIDVIFLRWMTSPEGNVVDKMPNGENLPAGYEVHPAFQNGESGFWIMIAPIGPVNGISDAIENTSSENTHLMKNTEYAAALFLSKYLENDEISFLTNLDGISKEYVAGYFNTGNGVGKPNNNFDEYSINKSDSNYYLSVKGHAMADTPWNIKIDFIEPKDDVPSNDKNYMVRDVKNGGLYYYEPVKRDTKASYRIVIPK